MRIARVIKQRLRSLLRRSQADSDLQRELEIHIEQFGQGTSSRGHGPV